MRIKLKELRTSKKMTQEQAAEALNISLIYVKNLESGTRSPSLKMAQKIAVTFGCASIDEILLKDA
ncbi:helix-turn-helix transcriptional regulator [Paenibacillus sp. 2RAB27]|uniref:helix-turn-helix transcriptional regulator n=1 Tax=Paenibacillus sp. 2RAB27 TaxID=3232991 RepID=UPI003F9AB852